jgi:curved DNA-binding protein CbpA
MNYYMILGVPLDANDESIRHAFRVLARRFHPNAGVGSSAEKFHRIFEAYETLRNPARRAAYDRSLQPEVQTERIWNRVVRSQLALNPFTLTSLLDALSSKKSSTSCFTVFTMIFFLVVGFDVDCRHRD